VVLSRRLMRLWRKLHSGPQGCAKIPGYGAVAQLGERVVCNHEVGSSILLSSTNGVVGSQPQAHPPLAEIPISSTSSYFELRIAKFEIDNSKFDFVSFFDN
jgi:hypothetical protein